MPALNPISTKQARIEISSLPGVFWKSIKGGKLSQEEVSLGGATPQDAYLVICDSSNNTQDALDAGLVNLDVIVKPSPTLEALNITLSR